MENLKNRQEDLDNIPPHDQDTPPTSIFPQVYTDRFTAPEVPERAHMTMTLKDTTYNIIGVYKLRDTDSMDNLTAQMVSWLAWARTRVCPFTKQTPRQINIRCDEGYSINNGLEYVSGIEFTLRDKPVTA